MAQCLFWAIALAKDPAFGIVPSFIFGFIVGLVIPIGVIITTTINSWQIIIGKRKLKDIWK